MCRTPTWNKILNSKWMWVMTAEKNGTKIVQLIMQCPKMSQAGKHKVDDWRTWIQFETCRKQVPYKFQVFGCSWLVVLGFNATLTAKVISWRSVTHMCFLAFSHQYKTFLSKATDYLSPMLLQRWEGKIRQKEKSPQLGIELTPTRSWVRHAHHWVTRAGQVSSGHELWLLWKNVTKNIGYRRMEGWTDRGKPV